MTQDIGLNSQIQSQTLSKIKKKNETKRKLDRDDLIQVYPFAMTFGTPEARPIMVFKDKTQEYVLPIWLNHFEAGVAIAQTHLKAPPFTPHNVALKLLESFKVEIAQCVFTEIRGHYQYAKLIFKNHPQVDSIEVRAEEVVSLCQYLKISFFAKKTFIQQSRFLNNQMGEGHPKAEIPKRPVIIKKVNPYLQ